MTREKLKTARRWVIKIGSSLLTAMDRIVPGWLAGCRLRPCWFEPTFHKHQGKLCSGFQIHVPKPVNLRDLTVAIARLTGRTD